MIPSGCDLWTRKAFVKNMTNVSMASDEKSNIDHVKADTNPHVHHEDRDFDKAGHALLKSEHDNAGIFATAKKFKKAVLICNLLCIAAAADGYQIVLSGNVIANVGFIRQVGFQNAEGEYYLNANYTALWGAMQSLGQLIGMVILNPISDRIGRKVTLYVLWAMLLASLVLETLVRDWKDWTGARILGGIGIGAIQATLPIYVTEWSPSNIRGAMVFTYGFWNSFGKFLPPMVLMLCELSDPMNYKVPILTQWGFLGIMLPIFLWLPETAAYYAARGQDEKGMATLRRVNGNVQGYDVETEYAIIKNTILEEKGADRETEAHTLKQLLRSYGECFNRQNARRTLGAAIPICAQQLTGLAFLNNYASLFFRQSGFDNAFLITTILTAISLLTATTLLFVTDCFGRRPVAVISATGCTVAMCLVGVLGLLRKTQPLQSLLIFVACVWSLFSNALGGLGWAFVGEVSSQRLRARTAGIAAGFSVVFGLTFNTTVPIMLDTEGANWGYYTAWLFFGTGLISAVLSWFFAPEPSRRNAAELDELYRNNVPAWRMRKYVTAVQLSNPAEHKGLRDES